MSNMPHNPAGLSVAEAPQGYRFLCQWEVHEGASVMEGLLTWGDDWISSMTQYSSDSKGNWRWCEALGSRIPDRKRWTYVVPLALHPYPGIPVSEGSPIAVLEMHNPENVGQEKVPAGYRMLTQQEAVVGAKFTGLLTYGQQTASSLGRNETTSDSIPEWGWVQRWSDSDGSRKLEPAYVEVWTFIVPLAHHPWPLGSRAGDSSVTVRRRRTMIID